VTQVVECACLAIIRSCSLKWYYLCLLRILSCIFNIPFSTDRETEIDRERERTNTWK
jgi:hypothetical protein